MIEKKLLGQRKGRHIFPLTKLVTLWEPWGSGLEVITKV